jgi:hypothetical protein
MSPRGGWTAAAARAPRHASSGRPGRACAASSRGSEAARGSSARPASARSTSSSPLARVWAACVRACVRVRCCAAARLPCVGTAAARWEGGPGPLSSSPPMGTCARPTPGPSGRFSWTRSTTPSVARSSATPRSDGVSGSLGGWCRSSSRTLLFFLPISSSHPTSSLSIEPFPLSFPLGAFYIRPCALPDMQGPILREPENFTPVIIKDRLPSGSSHFAFNDPRRISAVVNYRRRWLASSEHFQL